MAEPRPKNGPLQIHVSYSFDRLLESSAARPLAARGIMVLQAEDFKSGVVRKKFTILKALVPPFCNFEERKIGLSLIVGPRYDHSLND